MTILLVSILTFIVHVLGSFSYSTRLSGILTKRLTVSLSVGNFLALFSRLCSFLLIPLLSKKIEAELLVNIKYSAIPNHYLFILLAATAGCLAGIIFFENSIRFLMKCVSAYGPNKNLLRIIAESLFGDAPSPPLHIQTLPRPLTSNDIKYLVLSVFIHCVFTSATLAAIYSSYLLPEYRITALSLAFLLNGLASFTFATVIDPYISLQTDEAVTGIAKVEHFYYFVKIFLYSRLAGVFLSIFTLPLFTFAIIWIIKFF